MTGALPPLLLLGLAAAMALAGWMLVRASGAEVSLARRLAGARQLRVGDLPDADPLPSRPVRVVGRIRCPDPIVTDGDDRLVALHRDVQVRLSDGAWRTIERIRETRGFELWDHDGSLSLDPAQAAEPLVTIPHVWRGRPDELADEAHRSAVDRLAQEGRAAREARSVTRMVSVVDRLLVLAEVRRDAAGALALRPPRGGFVISTLDVPDAMRLLGGRGRSLMLAGTGLIGLAALLAVAGPLAWMLLR